MDSEVRLKSGNCVIERGKELWFNNNNDSSKHLENTVGRELVTVVALISVVYVHRMPKANQSNATNHIPTKHFYTYEYMYYICTYIRWKIISHSNMCCIRTNVLISYIYSYNVYCIYPLHHTGTLSFVCIYIRKSRTNNIISSA